ncbi:LacI family DNA-binding transcriptional regulator [Humibacter soli]
MTEERRGGLPGRGPSMQDVAKHAGVSSQTVSRVANGLQNVEDSTRKRVLDSMQALGYRPNKAARALRSGRFQSIGVAMFTLSSYGNMRMLDSVASAAADSGYSLTLVLVGKPTQHDVSAAFDRLLEHGVDGILIVIEAHLADAAVVELPAGLPVVVVDSVTRSDYPVVDNDQAGGARLATQHLLDLGHETVWHLAGPEPSYSATRRLDEWRSVLTRAGRTIPPVRHGDWSTMAGYQAGLELGARDDVTAVFAANDQMALGLMRAFHELGRDVPGDISVVGYDDMPEAESFWPPLTTVHQDFEAVGQRSVETLLAEIEDGPGKVGTLVVPTYLVVRSSTAAPTEH